MGWVMRWFALALLVVCAPARAGQGRLELWVLDVGQGSAALLSTPSGKTLLVDAGPPERAGWVARRVAEATGGGPLDLLVVTHPHADHVGGVPALLKSVGARAFYDPVLAGGGRIMETVYRHVARLQGDRRLEAHRVRAGKTEAVDFGDGVRVEFLGPVEPLLAGTRDDLNANSVVVRVVFGSQAVLLPGDASFESELRLLRLGEGLRADVLVVGHHGSSTSSSSAFLERVQASIGVVSAGEGNPYGHPHDRTLRRLAENGVCVLRTTEEGTVHVVLDGRSLGVDSERSGREGRCRVAAE